jgi:hypothetical protein
MFKLAFSWETVLNPLRLSFFAHRVFQGMCLTILQTCNTSNNLNTYHHSYGGIQARHAGSGTFYPPTLYLLIYGWRTLVDAHFQQVFLSSISFGGLCLLPTATVNFD